MKSIILALLVGSSTSFAAVSVPPATVDQPVCYGREYSSAHMEKSDKQTVKRMDIQFYREKDFPNTLLMRLKVDVKKESGYRDIGDGKKSYYITTRPYSNTLVCDTYDGKFGCYIECDGGSVGFEGGFGTTTKLVNKGVTVEGGCGEEGDTIWLDAVKGGDDYFTLQALPKEFCQK
jgi:hypothetical protein